MMLKEIICFFFLVQYEVYKYAYSLGVKYEVWMRQYAVQNIQKQWTSER